MRFLLERAHRARVRTLICFLSQSCPHVIASEANILVTPLAEGWIASLRRMTVTARNDDPCSHDALFAMTMLNRTNSHKLALD